MDSEAQRVGEADRVAPVSDPRLAAPLLALHAATDAETFWQASLAVLRAAMPAFHYLIALPTVGTAPVFLRTTLPVPDEADYWARLNRAAPLEETVARNAGRTVGRLSDDVPFILLRFTCFYRHFTKPAGWRYSTGLFFWQGERFLGHLGQNRTREQGDYTDAEMALLQMLHPYFDAAIQRIALLDHERAARHSLFESVQRSPLPMAVLDWELQPLHHNRAAAEAAAAWRLGAEAACATLAEFQLPAEIAAACRELRTAWEQSIRDAKPAEGGHSRTVAHPGGPEFRAAVRLSEADGARFTHPHFLVQFSLFVAGDDPDDALRLLGELTPGERAVALQAARGLDNQQIADALSVGTSTIRTHLRSIS